MKEGVLVSISLFVLSVHNKKLLNAVKPLVKDEYRLIDFVYSNKRVLSNYSELDIQIRRICSVLYEENATLSVDDLMHIDLLKGFGMTPSVHRSLKNAGFETIHQLKQLSKEQYDYHLKRGAGSIYKKAQAAIKEFESVFSEKYIDVISYVLLVEHDIEQPIDVARLIQSSNNFYSNGKEKVYETLAALIDDEILVRVKNKYYVKRWSLKDVLAFDFPNKDTYLMRLDGVSVREIGKSTGVSRTTVLTYVSRINANFIPHYLKENSYSKYITKYNMPRDTFQYVFQLDDDVISYLYNKFETNDFSTNVEAIVKDHILTKEALSRLLYFEKMFINSEGNVVTQSSTNLFEDLVYRYKDQSFALESFYEIYMNELTTNPVLNIKPTDIRRFESIIDNSYSVVKSIKHQFRYYDTNITQDTINIINNILSTLKGSYGLQFVYENHKKTLSKIGLINGYELGSLMNKVGLSKFNDVISIIRISTIQVGCSHQNFIEDKVCQFTGHSLNELLDHLQNDYGLHRDTMFTYISNQHVDYIFDGIIRCHNTIPKCESFYKEAKKRLTEPIYLVSEVMADLSEIANKELIPSKQLFHNLGYTTKGSAIIYKDTFNNAHEAIKAWIISKEVFETDTREIFKAQQWYSETYKLERDLIIFRLSPNELIHYTYLINLGISKPMVDSFIYEVKQFTKKFKYFTLPFLKKHGFKHELFDYLNDYTLERILATRQNIYPQSFSSPIIYTNDLNVQSKSDVLKDIYKKNPMSLNKMVKYLEKTYSLTISKVELKYRLSSTGALVNK